MTSLQLELLTHQEEPWKEARKGLSPTDTVYVLKKKVKISSLIFSIPQYRAKRCANAQAGLLTCGRWQLP